MNWFWFQDSAHYLLFSLMFLFADPVTVALGPVVLFAVLHLASYSLTLLDCLGTNNQNWWLGRMLISLTELYSRSILRMVAFSEVSLKKSSWITRLWSLWKPIHMIELFFRCS